MVGMQKGKAQALPYLHALDFWSDSASCFFHSSYTPFFLFLHPFHLICCISLKEIGWSYPFIQNDLGLYRPNIHNFTNRALGLIYFILPRSFYRKLVLSFVFFSHGIWAMLGLYLQFLKDASHRGHLLTSFPIYGMVDHPRVSLIIPFLKYSAIGDFLLYFSFSPSVNLGFYFLLFWALRVGLLIFYTFSSLVGPWGLVLLGFWARVITNTS